MIWMTVFHRRDVFFVTDLGLYHRRQLLTVGLGAAVALTMPFGAALAAPPRVLSFENLHTGEKLVTAYWADGRHRATACHRIDTILRDHRTGEVAPISTRLLDLLHTLRLRVDTDAPFEIISGYRSEATNAMLAKAGGGVARKSLHMLGMAVDIRVPGCSLARLKSAAVALKGGGVGFYPKSGFVHVDVGRVRYW